LISDGPHISYCSVCDIRACGAGRKVKNCAYCIEYGCEKLVKFHERAPKAKAELEETRKKTKKK
jgi:hypothetical protein